MDDQMKCLVLLACSLLAVGCTSPRKATLAEQQTCEQQTQKRFKRNEQIFYGNTVDSHFNPQTGVCYMRLINDSIHVKDDLGDQTIYRVKISNAFESRLYASYAETSWPDTGRHSVTECSADIPGKTTSVECTNLNEFNGLVKKYYGFGS